MTEENYVNGVTKTFNSQGNVKDLNHLILGVVSEIGEVIDLFKKHIGYGQEKNEEWLKQLRLEIGDCIWYTTMLQYYIGDSISIYAEGTIEIVFDEMKASKTFLHNCNELLLKNHASPEFLTSIQNIVIMLNFTAIAHDIEMEDVLISNLTKLQKRHGDKFNSDANMESGRNRNREEI